MENEPTSNHAPVPTDGGVPATHQAVLDANGFDPAEFEWRPVPRRPRADGWTPEVQQRFIAALMHTGVVERACEEVGMSVGSAYALRNAPGGEGLARAWRAALARAADRVLDVAFELAITGEEHPIFDSDGVRTGATRRINTRIMTLLLKAYHPERFRFADRETRRADEPAVAVAPPAPQVVASLTPITPAQPHLLATPARLDDMIYSAQSLANFQANFPSDDREPFRVRTAPADHPRVAIRARRNRVKRDERERRDEARYGFDDTVRYGFDPGCYRGEAGDDAST